MAVFHDLKFAIVVIICILTLFSLEETFTKLAKTIIFKYMLQDFIQRNEDPFVRNLLSKRTQHVFISYFFERAFSVRNRLQGTKVSTNLRNTMYGKE